MACKPHDYLTRGMAHEERKEFTAEYAASKHVLQRLESIALQRIERYIKDAEAEAMYDSSNYLLKVADNAGYRRALRDILPLIKTSDKRVS